MTEQKEENTGLDITDLLNIEASWTDLRAEIAVREMSKSTKRVQTITLLCMPLTATCSTFQLRLRLLQMDAQVLFFFRLSYSSGLIEQGSMSVTPDDTL